jgi:hypothetical protein
MTIMTLHFLPPALDAYEAAVDDAIATCNGDLRGALKALIIANELLERDSISRFARERRGVRSRWLDHGS